MKQFSPFHKKISLSPSSCRFFCEIPYRPLHHENALETARRPYWVLNTWHTEAEPMMKSMDHAINDFGNLNNLIGFL